MRDIIYNALVVIWVLVAGGIVWLVNLAWKHQDEKQLADLLVDKQQAKEDAEIAKAQKEVEDAMVDYHAARVKLANTLAGKK